MNIKNLLNRKKTHWPNWAKIYYWAKNVSLKNPAYRSPLNLLGCGDDAINAWKNEKLYERSAKLRYRYINFQIFQLKLIKLSSQKTKKKTFLKRFESKLYFEIFWNDYSCLVLFRYTQWIEGRLVFHPVHFHKKKRSTGATPKIF